MIIYADTHVHLYPCYDFNRAFDFAWENFTRAAQGKPGFFVLYLTERADCNFFDQLAGNPGGLVDRRRWQVSILETPEVLELKRSGGGLMYLVAGRQIKTDERLEILVLHTRRQFSDGGSLTTRLEQLLSEEDVLVLNWSLGKWMFERAAQIERAIKHSSFEKIQIGDIPGRPRGWGEPRLFKLAAERKFAFLAGSDPLPFAGEERRLASYVSRFELPAYPEESIQDRWFFRDILLPSEHSRSVCGRRNSFPDMGLRFLKNAQAAKIEARR